MALALVGRKGRDFFMRRGFDVATRRSACSNNVKWSHAQAIAKTCIEEFLGPDVSSVYLVYNEFRSVISQRVVIERLLPIPKLGAAVAGDRRRGLPVRAVARGTAERRCCPYHVSVQVARALLESSAAEHAARMTAMDAATRNAKDMVDRLTLYMNKVRQASITREIIEIVAGAQSV